MTNFKPFDKEPTMEDWFFIWAEELKRAGFINDIVLHDNITALKLLDPVKASYDLEKVLYRGTKREQTKVVKKTRTMLQGVEYTPDFIIRWNDDAKGIFFTPLSDIKNWDKTYFRANRTSEYYYTPLDVKSPFMNQHRSDVSFSIKRKMVYDKYKVMVEKAIMFPASRRFRAKDYLFLATFTPQRFLLTNKTLQQKTIRLWKPIGLEEFI